MKNKTTTKKRNDGWQKESLAQLAEQTTKVTANYWFEIHISVRVRDPGAAEPSPAKPGEEEPLPEVKVPLLPRAGEPGPESLPPTQIKDKLKQAMRAPLITFNIRHMWQETGGDPGFEYSIRFKGVSVRQIASSALAASWRSELGKVSDYWVPNSGMLKIEMYAFRDWIYALRRA